MAIVTLSGSEYLHGPDAVRQDRRYSLRAGCRRQRHLLVQRLLHQSPGCPGLRLRHLGHGASLCARQRHPEPVYRRRHYLGRALLEGYITGDSDLRTRGAELPGRGRQAVYHRPEHRPIHLGNGDQTSCKDYLHATYRDRTIPHGQRRSWQPWRRAGAQLSRGGDGANNQYFQGRDRLLSRRPKPIFTYQAGASAMLAEPTSPARGGHRRPSGPERSALPPDIQAELDASAHCADSPARRHQFAAPPA